MAVTIKTEHEIELMRNRLHKNWKKSTTPSGFYPPGISTKEIDEYGEQLIQERGGIPNFLNYNGYPASICVSVNDESCSRHPDKKRISERRRYCISGCWPIWKGYHSDAAYLGCRKDKPRRRN